MDNEKDVSASGSEQQNLTEHETPDLVQNQAPGRIQFTETAKPPRRESVAPILLPPVQAPSSEKKGGKGKIDESKNVNIDEHLMDHKDVAERYKSHINLEKPGESLGLTSQQAEELLVEHGRNVLTPSTKRHPFLKFLDNLTSLFNLLLIFAGVLEYILLGIDYKNNFQNVSTFQKFPNPFVD